MLGIGGGSSRLKQTLKGKNVMFAKITFALLTTLVIATAALAPANAGPGSPNEVAREAVCATGCGGGN